MAAFEFTALDADGQQQRGVLEGDTARQIRQQLRARGLTPLAVSPADARERPDRPQPGLLRPASLGAGDLALVTRQLATLIAAGTPVEEALRTASRQTDKPRAERLLMAVRARVVEGHSLAAALAAYPRSFPPVYVASVRAGEQAGRLGAVLEHLAEHSESRQETRTSIGAMLAYPMVLAAVALLIVIALLAYIVPEVVGVFASLDAELPALTRGLIALSDFIRAWGIGLLIGLVVAVAGGRWALRRPAIRYQRDRLLLRLPVIGGLVRGANTGRFTRTLSILVSSGVPVLEALRIAATAIDSLPMQRAVEHAATEVREGGSLHRALARSGYFPPLVVHLVASGEQSGQLDAMLQRAAGHQERETRMRVTVLASLLEPAVILFAGVVVMLIVLAVLLPIFELNRLVR